MYYQDFFITGTDFNIGFLGYSTDDDLENIGSVGIAIGAETTGPANTENTGMIGVATGDDADNVGVSGETFGTGVRNAGVEGYAEDGDENYGGYFFVDGGNDSTSTNYAVYGDANGSSKYWAGYFNGYVFSTQSLRVSDMMFKEDVKEIKNAMNIITKLQPKTYTYNSAEFPSINLPEGVNYGLIAQEVEKILPDIVTDITHPAKRDQEGNIIAEEVDFKGLNYTAIVPFLIQGMKDQQAVIEEQAENMKQLNNEIFALQETVQELRGLIGDICHEGCETLKNLSGDLGIIGNLSTAELHQNVPNPFSEATDITFYLPEKVKDATLYIYDMNGTQIERIEVAGRGNANVTLKAGQLKAGMYLYSLFADDVEVGTKRMVLTK